MMGSYVVPLWIFYLCLPYSSSYTFDGRHSITKVQSVNFVMVRNARVKISLLHFDAHKKRCRHSVSPLYHNLEDRKDFLHHVTKSALLGLTVGLVSDFHQCEPSLAAVTDETKSFFANTAADAINSSPYLSNTPSDVTLSRQLLDSSPDDEIKISIPFSSFQSSSKEGGLGIELSDIEFRTNRRVYIKSVRPNSLASTLGIKKDWIVVSVDGMTAERTNAEGVARMVSMAMKSRRQLQEPQVKDAINSFGSPSDIVVIFRDPSIFQSRLNRLSSAPSSTVTTQVAPAGDTTQRNLDGTIRAGNIEKSQTDQRIVVSQLIPPKICTRGAQIDDLLEISYLGMVVETGDVFDGSAIKIEGQAIPGRGNDVSIFFVLGKQPFGQFPPGWDVGLQGMCVGERRRLLIPPALAYGSVGFPRRGIPPDATLQYDITLVSLNGLANPQ